MTALNKDALAATAAAMLANGQGILAADESTGTIEKRLASIKVTSTEAARRDWRALLFGAAGAMEQHIGGVILFEETLFQKDKDGTPLCDVITKHNAVVGIKVDKGAKPLALSNGETVTEGLDGLRERLADYHKAGARFTKWRAVLSIGTGDNDKPSAGAIAANMHALARYAALAQEAGMVPIVEPEILMDGPHELQACEAATRAALVSLYEELTAANVWLEGTILKPNMVLAGADCATQAGEDEVAAATLRVLTDCVPAAVPGIAFLSGGQSDIKATAHLDKINRLASAQNAPWRLSFSYGRALQAAPLQAWQGKPEAVADAQQAFAHRAKMNALASQGQWSEALEQAAP